MAFFGRFSEIYTFHFPVAHLEHLGHLNPRLWHCDMLTSGTSALQQSFEIVTPHRLILMLRILAMLGSLALCFAQVIVPTHTFMQ